MLFRSTDREEAWQQGFVAGWLSPDDDHAPPMPLTTDQQEAYVSGVAAGRISVRGVRLPATATLGEKDGWGEMLHIAVDMAEFAHGAFEISAELAEGTAIAGTVGASLIFTFLSVSIWGPDGVPSFDEAAESAVGTVMKQLSEGGAVTDNVELYMAACDRTDHGPSDQGDDLTSRGWWHGRIYTDFEHAAADAMSHEHVDDARVLRFQSAAPDLFEVIDVSALSRGTAGN